MTATIIIAVIIFVILLANYSHNKEIKDRVNHEGGMLNKYSVLIDALKSDDSNSRIFKITDNFVKLGIKNFSGSVIFTIRQDVTTIIVGYKITNKLSAINRELNWEFPEDLDQEEMMRKIKADITMDNLKAGSVI